MIQIYLWLSSEALLARGPPCGAVRAFPGRGAVGVDGAEGERY